MLIVTAAWTLFAFAGIYPWTTIPLALGVIALAYLALPHPFRDRPLRVLDAALVAVLGAIALQLVPLPPNLRVRIAPSSVAYERLLYVLPAQLLARVGPITVDAEATWIALYLAGLTIALFWAARATFERGGTRTTIRALSWMGLVVALLASLQHRASPKLFYGIWRPVSTNALPFGPFVNKNDFAAWLVMLIPLVSGYAISRIQSRRRPGDPIDPETTFDGKGAWMSASIFVMTAALLTTLSRSALTGGVAGLAMFVILSKGRMSSRWIGWILFGVVATVALALMYVNLDLLSSRLSGASSEGLASRFQIWRQTLPMVQDFWPVGSGVGTYQRVMVLYQTSSRLFYISHADNEYLQIAAEGGALLGIPAAMVIVGTIAGMVRRLRADRTPAYWIRVGATCGIVTLAVQNLFEMTLRVPANAVLLAILAAVALHEAPMSGRKAHDR